MPSAEQVLHDAILVIEVKLEEARRRETDSYSSLVNGTLDIEAYRYCLSKLQVSE